MWDFDFFRMLKWTIQQGRRESRMPRRALLYTLRWAIDRERSWESISASCSPKVCKLKIDSEIFAFQEGNGRLELILALAQHPHLFTLNLPLDFQF